MNENPDIVRAVQEGKDEIERHTGIMHTITRIQVPGAAYQWKEKRDSNKDTKQPTRSPVGNTNTKATDMYGDKKHYDSFRETCRH